MKLRIKNNPLPYKAALYSVIVLACSCRYFKKPDRETPVARVNQTYLYRKDIKALLAVLASKKDSALAVRNLINKWATEQLLISKAKLNLSWQQQNRFNKLAEQYKNDLYTKAYMGALVKKNIDTSVSEQQILKYYQQNKAAFKLNEALVKFRYVYLNPKMPHYLDIKKAFERYHSEDKKILKGMSVHFKAYFLNDSVWIKTSQIFRKIPALTQQYKKQLLKPSSTIKIADTSGVYLLKVNDVLLRNHIAPLVYVKPTIRHIFINKQKLALIEKLKTDIREDAFKNKQFEIYK